ncbi:hypothetical protein F0U60_19675 [Archangium minus]|uniref:DUF5658 domain-containing protein n=1 Tax=Archangium minus TaxID=83450 RepID=A0ABY9WR13_9BACT|nr:DUF5658 family protein [Archangium violaceum]QRK05008.1 hypothetical protein JQX13_33005 [Archangium violaceum]WNG35656.1 hypothetical protein F0U61_19775 [Archangium violaceum]WNG46085.1 hypothetical protein F0U60_19675 [Archangium minus]
MAATTQATRWAGIEGASFHISPAAALLLVLNLLDGLFTLTFLQLDVAEELNPLMRMAYEHSPLAFMASKLAIVSLGLTLLCLHRSMRISQRAIQAGAALYTVIDIYHLAFLAHMCFRSVG